MFNVFILLSLQVLFVVLFLYALDRGNDIQINITAFAGIIVGVANVFLFLLACIGCSN